MYTDVEIENDFQLSSLSGYFGLKSHWVNPSAFDRVIASLKFAGIITFGCNVKRALGSIHSERL